MASRASGDGVTLTSRVRTQLPVVVLAIAPALLALRFGGYHVRHGGWMMLALLLWACVQAARGRMPALRSIGGAASFALVALAAWTCASIGWAQVSTHDAWVEGVRASGYAAAFLVAGSVLANVRAYRRFATAAGSAVGLLALVTLARMAFSDAPLRAFVAGRIDWPVGYAPGLAALHLIGMLLLVGASCSAQRAWRVSGSGTDRATAAVTLALAGACASVAVLAQSRGTAPAVVVSIVVLLLVAPSRSAVLVRLAMIIAGLVAIGGPLARVFQTQFDYRQAPFTPGADASRLLEVAVSTAQHAGQLALALVALLLLAGMFVPVVSERIIDTLVSVERRMGMGLAMPITVLVVTLIAALGVLSVVRASGPGAWARQQLASCIDPSEQVNDPGSSRSYFANSGTGRCDYYRVALLTARKDPVLGTGSGNFRAAYVLERRTAEEPRTTHSLPLQLLSELGLVGAALGGVFVGALVLASVRFVQSGPMRDPTFAGAIAALGYWLAHASIDWLWQLPAVTLIAMFAAGGLAACVSPGQARVRASVGAPLAAAGMLASIALVLPVTMADAKLREARDPIRRASDPEAALAAARQAQAFDPAWAEPYITEGSIEYERGRNARAAAAGRAAVRAEPRSWSVQYRASGLIGLEDPAAGARAHEAAQRLNPRLDADARRRAPQPSADSLQDPDA